MGGDVHFETIGDIDILGIFRDLSSPNSVQVWKFVSMVGSGVSVISLFIGGLEYSAAVFSITQLVGGLFAIDSLWHVSGSTAWLNVPGVGLKARVRYGSPYNVSRCWLSPNASPNWTYGCYLGSEFFGGELVLLVGAASEFLHGWRITYTGYTVVTTSDETGYDEEVKWFPAGFDVEVGSPR